MLLEANDPSLRTLASIVISAATTGYTSSSISFDWDVDPKARKESPSFYGYIPDGHGRALIFVCMIMNSTLLMLLRCSSVTALILVDKSYCFWYVAGDMLFYLLQKIARRDFSYWIPIYGAPGLFVSLIVRVIAKVIVDFTGLVHLRHSGELGGIYWTVDMIISMILPVAATTIYYADTSGKPMEEKTVWWIIGSLIGIWLVVFGLFLSLMKKEYRNSFFSFETGAAFDQNKFLFGEDDYKKAQVMNKSRMRWKSIEMEVQTWVRENWERWEEEQPDWFTEAWKSRVPEEMIPSAALTKLKFLEGRERRRSSLIDSLREGLSERNRSVIYPLEDEQVNN